MITAKYFTDDGKMFDSYNDAYVYEYNSKKDKINKKIDEIIKTLGLLGTHTDSGLLLIFLKNFDKIKEIVEKDSGKS